jgi:hypothetical protein
MKTLSNYNKIQLGFVDEKPIYLSPPSWDCDWYWGFGYLGNKNCHYHVKGMEDDCPIYEAWEKHFKDTFIVKDKSDIWTLSELFQTFYGLAQTAEILGRGGSHWSNNPCQEIIKNKDEVDRINQIVLPQIFEEIYKIFARYK